MKKIIIVAGFFFCLPFITTAQEYKAALGVRLTAAPATVNNALSFRYFVNEKSAFEALVSFDPAALGVLYERFAPTGAAGLQWYYGGGLYAATEPG